MSVNDLSVHPRILQALRKGRVTKTKELICLSRAYLQRKFGFSQHEVTRLLEVASHQLYPARYVRLCDVYHGSCTVQNQHFKCTTGCQVIDAILSGGILLPGISEISGESSAGKTQFCMQLCLTSQLPKHSGGRQSGCLYISTEDAFPVKRLKQMADTFYNNHQCDFKQHPMDHIYIEHAGDLDDLWFILRKKVKPMLDKGLLSLIIVDSIAALFRVEFEIDEIVERSRALIAFGKELVRLSREYTIGIICVNQVSDVVGSIAESASRDKRVKPALGLTWSYMVTTRLMLSRTTWTLSCFTDPELSQKKSCNKEEDSTVVPSDPTVRLLKVIFAPHLDNNEVYFYIDQTGLHGVNL